MIRVLFGVATGLFLSTKEGRGLAKHAVNKGYDALKKELGYEPEKANKEAVTTDKAKFPTHFDNA